jgi:hypothetical protein
LNPKGRGQELHYERVIIHVAGGLVTDPVFTRECALGKRAVARSSELTKAPAETWRRDFVFEQLDYPSSMTTDRGRVELRRVLMYQT